MVVPALTNGVFPPNVRIVVEDSNPPPGLPVAASSPPMTLGAKKSGVGSTSRVTAFESSKLKYDTTNASALGVKAAVNNSALATGTSKRNGKVRIRQVLNFLMVPPKGRRITPLVSIPIGMARHFLRFFLGVKRVVVEGGTRC